MDYVKIAIQLVIQYTQIHKAFLLQNDMLGMRNIYLSDIDMCIVGTLEQFRF